MKPYKNRAFALLGVALAFVLVGAVAHRILDEDTGSRVGALKSLSAILAPKNVCGASSMAIVVFIKIGNATTKDEVPVRDLVEWFERDALVSHSGAIRSGWQSADYSRINSRDLKSLFAEVWRNPAVGVFHNASNPHVAKQWNRFNRLSRANIFESPLGPNVGISALRVALNFHQFRHAIKNNVRPIGFSVLAEADASSESRQDETSAGQSEIDSVLLRDAIRAIRWLLGPFIILFGIYGLLFFILRFAEHETTPLSLASLLAFEAVAVTIMWFGMSLWLRA